MNYGQIISQAWQILKRSRLFWLFGLFLFLSSVLPTTIKSSNQALICISFFFPFVSLFLGGLSFVGRILCADKVSRGEIPLFKEIWRTFKSYFWRLVLLSIALLIPYGILFLCSFISLVPINMLTNNAFNDTGTRIFLASSISGPCINAINLFSMFGFLLHKMGILKSIRHGLSVFNTNILKSVALFLIVNIPFYTSYLAFWLIQFSMGNPLSLNSFFAEAMKYPFKIWFSLITVVVSFFSSTSFLLAYYQFINNFDYPTLRQVTPKM